jgi:hypothetical protein
MLLQSSLAPDADQRAGADIAASEGCRTREDPAAGRWWNRRSITAPAVAIDAEAWS